MNGNCDSDTIMHGGLCLYPPALLPTSMPLGTPARLSNYHDQIMVCS